MNEHYYKTLDAYKVAKELVKCIYQLLKKFPREEQYALCDQLRRAAISDHPISLRVSADTPIKKNRTSWRLLLAL